MTKQISLLSVTFGRSMDFGKVKLEDCYKIGFLFVHV
jgi:hypothetical protein